MWKPRQIVDFLFSLMKTIIISLFISLKVISFQTDKQGQDGILSALPFLGDQGEIQGLLNSFFVLKFNYKT